MMTLIELRDLRLARAEYEVGREIVMRLPTADRNVSQLQKAAVEKESSLDAQGAGPITSQQRVQLNP
jgi:hypothetical protein